MIRWRNILRFGLAQELCATVDDLVQTKQHLHRLVEHNNVLYAELRQAETERDGFSAAVTEFQHLVDELIAERDELLQAGVVAEAERILRNEEAS